MKNFKQFKKVIHEQFIKMSKSELFCVDIEKDELWGAYLKSFPEGSNPIFRERTEHDCQCCKQFIRACGNVVAIIDNKLISIWDVIIGGHYQVVADALSKLVKSEKVENTFLHYEANLGTDSSLQQLKNGGILKFDHFHYKLPNKFVKHKDEIGTVLSNIRSGKEVFKRGLDEISIDAVETVLELIEQKSIYRGEEHKSIVDLFLKHKVEYDKLEVKHQDNYCWSESVILKAAARIRNSVIGTLLVDVSDGKELDFAVRSFETKVAPTNYKRPTAVITKSMIENAQKKVEELGIGDSLQRRFAVQDDITINNVLFADRSVKKAMNVFDEMSNEVPDDVKKMEKVDEVEISTFINDILPKAESIELMLENRHSGNLMSLIAPVNKDAMPIFSWHNNFSWAYNGDIADSMKERVKKAGGNVEGVLRFTIQWNDGDNNQNDFDAHCIEPNGNLIDYHKKGRIQPSSGMLDVDIQQPGNKVAVENIIHTDINKIQPGDHEFLVHNYRHNGGKTGFTAQIEYDGKIYSYSYGKELRQGEKVSVATVNFNKESGFKFVKSLPSSQSSKQVWNVATQKFQKVSMIMNSPNHWDEKANGNKHLFFILDGCKNENSARGFFNEFLKSDLIEHRKVFEVLGSKMKASVTDNQLSGLGFSSTQKNSIFCKVTGAFTRTIKINF